MSGMFTVGEVKKSPGVYRELKTMAVPRLQERQKTSDVRLCLATGER